MQYFEPNFVDEALVLLDRYAPRVRVLAGGSLLGFEIRGRPSDAAAIVNVKRIPELREIGFDGRMLTIGALVTARELCADEFVRRHAPLVALAAASVGARQLRTVATIGGNACSGHPAADLSAALLASDARCVVSEITAGPSVMPVADFVRLDRSARDPRTLLTALEIPSTTASVAYHKMQTRRAFEMALVAVGVALEIEQGAVRAARVALGGAAPTPIRAAQTEIWLRGKPASDATAREAADMAATRDAQPADDQHASAEYRRQLVAVLAERALRDAFGGHEAAR